MSDDKAKVLIFSVTYFPFIGGAEVALAEITKRIKDVQFDLITAKISKNLLDIELVDNLTIRRVGSGSKIDKFLYPMRAFFLARQLNKKEKYNLVWAMLATWAGLAAFLFKLFNPKVKYLLTLQSGDSDWFLKIRTWFWYPIYRMVYTKADHIQVISHWLKKRARRYGYKKEISIIPNGVDLEKFKPTEKPKKNIIFTSSRLVKKNGIETLIKSIHLLLTDYGLPVTLIIAGSGKQENKLKKLARKLNLESKIIFLGQVERHKILEYYHQADIFVRPSLSEGQGVSFIEAMATGLPIIATPVGGIPDFLLDKKTGLFCEVNNAQDLAKKINLLLTNKKFYQEIQKNSLALVKQKYDWNLIAARMKDIIKKL